MSTQIKSSTRFSRLSFTYLRKIMDEIIELVIESYLEKFETACNFFSFSLLFSFLREQTLFRSLWAMSGWFCVKRKRAHPKQIRSFCLFYSIFSVSENSTFMFSSFLSKTKFCMFPLFKSVSNNKQLMKASVEFYTNF